MGYGGWGDAARLYRRGRFKSIGVQFDFMIPTPFYVRFGTGGVAISPPFFASWMIREKQNGSRSFSCHLPRSRQMALAQARYVQSMLSIPKRSEKSIWCRGSTTS
jgi:hypothetical protein